jgi:Ca2+-binding RTX toxin-like protein
MFDHDRDGMRANRRWYKPQVESLEDRRLLSVSPILVDGALGVLGTNSADRIEAYVEAGELIVHVNDATDDTLYGGIGNDWLFGGWGDDELHGGFGGDVLDGGVGADGLYGNAGDDLLTGGPGNDYLEGGIGRDVVWAIDGFADSISADEDDQLFIGPLDTLV